MKIIDISKNLDLAKSRFDNEIQSAEIALKNKIKFNFTIEHQPSDGFIILDDDSSEAASLIFCLEIINNKGKLTQEDFNQITI